jgi:hypothetical protein
VYSFGMKLFAALTLAFALAAAPAVAQAPAHRDGDMAMPEKPPVPPSKFLNVNFQGKTVTFTVEDLLKMPQVTVHVHNAHRNTDEEYTGPLVSDVLAKAGLSPAHENEQLILRSSVVATGTDGYYVVYSAAELEPAFTSGQSIVAVMKSGLPDSEGGVIQMINANAVKPARWVHGLTNLNVMTLTPSK